MLRRRGVRHHDIDEIVQETATRVISTGVSYDDADDLFRWASVVGGRLAIDLRRRGARFSDDELPDRADTIDVAMTAEHRVVLGAVRTRLPELSARDQELLLSTFGDESATSRRESVRLAVARHRARNRLRILLDGLAGTAIFMWIRRNRVWSAPADAIAYALVPAAACMLITIGAWTGLDHSATNEARSQPMLASEVAPTPPSSGLLTPTDRKAADGSGGASQSPSHRSAVPGVKDPYLVIDQPDGDHAHVGIRDKEASDHLWCVTISPTGSPQETCVDSPIPLPKTP